MPDDDNDSDVEETRVKRQANDSTDDSDSDDELLAQWISEHETEEDSGKMRWGSGNKIKMVPVNMPNGDKVKIARVMGDMDCGTPTRLINLNPDDGTESREYELVKKQLIDTKKEHISGHFSNYDIIKIEKVVNGCFWRRYRKRQNAIYNEVGYVNERMLFHGTNKVNELLQYGFDERYANIDGMFGAGIYFAKDSSKSNQYAFGLMKPCPTHDKFICFVCERQMLLCRVALGKVKVEQEANKRSHPPPRHHSVKGKVTPHGLQFEEFIVYRGEQVYPEYVITYKIVP